MSRALTSYVMGSGLVRRQRAFTKDDLVKAKLVFRILFLLGFIAILSLFYIWPRVQILQYGYDINALKARQHQLLEANKKLRMEVATLKSPRRVEKFAAGNLGMRPIQTSQIKILPEAKNPALPVLSAGYGGM
ncbi:MAG: cell division protein FtsL [Deltaproteobacteria bacterium]|nr:cell division protein FtsL [Deltaproteobacteria bacterium]